MPTIISLTKILMLSKPSQSMINQIFENTIETLMKRSAILQYSVMRYTVLQATCVEYSMEVSDVLAVIIQCI